MPGSVKFMWGTIWEYFWSVPHCFGGTAYTKIIFFGEKFWWPRSPKFSENFHKPGSVKFIWDTIWEYLWLVPHCKGGGLIQKFNIFWGKKLKKKFDQKIIKKYKKYIKILLHFKQKYFLNYIYIFCKHFLLNFAKKN